MIQAESLKWALNMYLYDKNITTKSLQCGHFSHVNPDIEFPCELVVNYSSVPYTELFILIYVVMFHH